MDYQYYLTLHNLTIMYTMYIPVIQQKFNADIVCRSIKLNSHFVNSFDIYLVFQLKIIVV